MKNYFYLLTILFLTAFPVTAQNVSPEQRIKDYFKAFNSGDEKAMRDFFNENIAAKSLAERTVEQRLEFYKRMLGDMESVEVKQITSENPTEITAAAQTKRGEWLNFTFSFEPSPPQKIIGMRVDMSDAPKDSGANRAPLTNAEFLTSVEGYLDKTVEADEFSGAVLIAKNDKPIYEKAFGLADKDKNIPNRTDTKFNLGSINKIFTQVAVQQLVEQGKISLEDKLGKYLPDYPNAEAREKVTVRHLLTMTSGIGDIFGENYLKTPKKNLRNIKDFIPLFSGEPLAFEPGMKNQYSNGGYILLGAIIEKVSGKNYYDYMYENIFNPLGMTDTKFYESDKPTPNVAEGYTKNSPNQIDKNRRQNNFDTRPARGSSAGGGYSTLADMLKFSLALQNGKVHLPNQQNFSGIGIAGGAPGINAMLEVMPQSGYTIVVLSNYDPPSAGTVSKELRNLVKRIKE